MSGIANGTDVACDQVDASELLFFDTASVSKGPSKMEKVPLSLIKGWLHVQTRGQWSSDDPYTLGFTILYNAYNYSNETDGTL